MYVYINTLFDVSIHEKTEFIYKRVKFMVNFFQHKSYGESVNEIAIAAVVTTEDQLKYYGFGVSYSARSKRIGMLLNIDISLAQEKSNMELLLHLETVVYDEIEKLRAKKIKDFDLNEFLTDMSDFFRIINVENSDALDSKFHEHSEDVKKWHNKKVRSFLKGD